MNITGFRLVKQDAAMMREVTERYETAVHDDSEVEEETQLHSDHYTNPVLLVSHYCVTTISQMCHYCVATVSPLCHYCVTVSEPLMCH